ncbi:MAG: T9SS type A sorting domain-containing protein [Rhodothermales bacterium]|nr:T9SS type A sorting domain-containing protein [Rhodothermales bacterium]
MRKPILFGLTSLFVLFNTSSAQILDSVKVETIPYDYGYFDFPYHNCGAGIYSRWPDRKAQVTGVPSAYTEYTLDAEGDKEDGFWVPFAGTQIGSWPEVGWDIPEGYFGQWPFGTGAQGGETVYESCADFKSIYEGIWGGAPTFSGTTPFIMSQWYAVWSVPNDVPIADFSWKQTSPLGISLDGSFRDFSFEVEDDEKVPVSSYQWIFSDGDTLGGAVITKFFAEPGSYSATLVVTDNDGQTNDITKGVTVEAVLLQYEEEVVQKTVLVGETFTVIGKVRNIGSAPAAEVTVRPLFGFIPTYPESDHLESTDGTRGEPAESKDPVVFSDVGPGVEKTVTQIYTVETGAVRDCDDTVETCAASTIPVPVIWEATLATVTGKDADGNSVEVRDKCVEGVECENKMIVNPKSRELIVNVTGDESDADLSDEFCDVDEQQEEEQCTLRAAIEIANDIGGADIIFDIPGGSIPVISIDSALPVVITSTSIDGTTQPEGMVHIQLDSGVQNGLEVSGADGFSIAGLSITHFGGWGIRFDGGDGHEVLKSAIGFLPGDEGAIAFQGLGSIIVENGATNVTIGGIDDEDENRIFGRIDINGSNTTGISVLRNELRIPFLQAGPSMLPVDLNGDGPSCFSWEQGEGGPNDAVAAPRLLSIESGKVTGMTRPNSDVIVFKVENSGLSAGRYWPAWVLPVGNGTADADGFFSIGLDEQLGEGVEVTALAIDDDGNTSELAQLKRPVIYLPGIGGSWLKAADGTNIWIPFGLDGGIGANNRLVRMAMDSSGTSLEPLTVDGVLELGGIHVYGPAVASIADAGYADTDNTVTRDLWRFPYDWRTNTADRATELYQLVDLLTIDNPDVARSCEVDLVAHSNGNLVSSIYIKRDADHARDHVHRYVGVAAPYLGAGKAAAAHAVGYVFDVEKTPGVGFEVEWGRMIGMARNLVGAYGLLPSKLYWDATDLNSISHKHNFLFQDLYGNRLQTFESTARFLGDPKVGGNGEARGMGRNGSMITGQQEDVHTHIDDWREYDGPPQVFRQAGALHASTVTGWVQGPWLSDKSLEPFELSRFEPGDTRRHDIWRERTTPIFGWGDETVPLVSATLGADNRVGALDLSGEDSPWVEPVQNFACTHTGIILDDCRDKFGGSVSALTEVQRMLKSGYSVVAEDNSTTKKTDEILIEGGADIFYVVGSGPIAAIVTDSLGNTTGPISLEDFRAIEYGVPGISYWPSDNTIALSVPRGRVFDIEVISVSEDINVRATRMLVDDLDETRLTVLFNDQPVNVNGAMRFTIHADGTPSSEGFEVDVDGDGSFESTLEPAGEVEGDVAFPAIPYPDRSVISIYADGSESVTSYIKLPDVGSMGWSWELHETSDWIMPIDTTGNAPHTIELQLAAETLTDTLSVSSVDIDLHYGDYSVSVNIPVEVRIGAFTVDVTASDDQVVPDDFSLDKAYPNPFDHNVSFDVHVPVEGQLAVHVFDMVGRRMATLWDGTARQGIYSLSLSGAGMPAGVYFVRAMYGGQVRSTSIVKTR